MSTTNCSRCGNVISANLGSGAVCSTCHSSTYAGPVTMPYDAKQTKQITADTRSIVLSTCSDNGACGCTTKNRRTFFLGAFILFLIGGFFQLATTPSGQENPMIFTFFVAAGWCATFLFLCPNGPYGVFSATKDLGRMTSDDINTCGGVCGGHSSKTKEGLAYASMDNGTAPLNPDSTV
jgi:hypothetical protein